jgi:integrase
MEIKLRYVEKIRIYYYYHRGGKRWRLHGEPGSRQFLKDYDNAEKQFGGTVPFHVTDSFSGVIDAYLDSPEFKDLSEASQANYKTYLGQMRPIFGPSPIHEIKRKHIKAYRNSISSKRGAANQSVSVLKAVMAWAIDADLIEVNPAAGIKRLKGGEHLPWPEPLIERFFAEAPEHLVWAVAIGLWTGQRRERVLGLKWSNITDGVIHFKAHKGGEDVWVPILPALDTCMVSIPRRSTHILTNRQGKVWIPVSFGQEFRKYMRGIGAGEYKFHGLRKNFMEEASEAGGTTAEVKSWSGHKSDAMVEFYTKRADRKRLAKSMRDKLLKTRLTVDY